ncbi:hypothetical protein ANAEL_01140 [Anaerolineales bacterium]|nr:hypothetical protein ANAEL_01140 [Anaerolineales bacterium]
MSQILFLLSTWLHALATVVMIGHYLLLALLYLPVLSKENGGGAILSAISKRSRVWIYAALGVFAVTGTHLIFVDSNYLGIGNFGNLWSMLMLVKHLLIMAMITLGFWYNAVLRVGPMMSSNNGADQAITRFGLYSKLMAGCGVLVLLLTAIAQVK